MAWIAPLIAFSVAVAAQPALPFGMSHAAARTLAVAGVSTDARRERLFGLLASARSEAEGRAIEDEIWRFWLDLAPDPQSRKLVDGAMERRESYDFAAAEALLDEAVTRAPDYAEAWNQRAFIRYLRDNDEGAEADLLRTLELEPRHFGALAGLFLVLYRQGRVEQANASLERAVRIHPWLKERTMLPPDAAGTRPPVAGQEQDL